MTTYIRFFFSESQDFSYVFNPINAMHLLKRMSNWLPKLKSKFPKLNLRYNARSLSDDYKNACHGIADLVEYYDLSPMDLANSEIKENNSTTSRACSKISIEELLHIADEAKSSLYLDGYVDWIKTALERAQLESMDKKLISKLK